VISFSSDYVLGKNRTSSYLIPSGWTKFASSAQTWTSKDGGIYNKRESINYL